METEFPGLHDGEKYASLTLTGCLYSDEDLSTSRQIGSDLWVLPKFPFSLGEPWIGWIGSLRTSRLQEPGLFFIAKVASSSPQVLDGQNQELTSIAIRFYRALLIVCRVQLASNASVTTGSCQDKTVGVRQIFELPLLYSTLGVEGVSIEISHLSDAMRISAALSAIKGKKFRRLRFAIGTFFKGLEEKIIDERLHQFCRCIEGLILPRSGATTKQFKSRTELFIGPSHHALAGLMYECRSAQEHLNDPVLVLAGADEKSKRLELCRLTFLAEEISRYCLSRILLDHNLQDFFEDDVSLNAFWDLQVSVREKLWGPKLNLDLVENQFSHNSIDDSALALG